MLYPENKFKKYYIMWCVSFLFSIFTLKVVRLTTLKEKIEKKNYSRCDHDEFVTPGLPGRYYSFVYTFKV